MPIKFCTKVETGIINAKSADLWDLFAWTVTYTHAYKMYMYTQCK